MAIGACTLMVSEATTRYPAVPASYCLYVEEAHAAVQDALNAGATLEMEAQDMAYGDRQGGVRDPAGNIWRVSQRIVEAPYTE